MKRKTVSISTLIVLLSLISLIIEIAVYYVSPNSVAPILVSWAAALFISHFCLEASYEYGYGLVNVIFMLVGSIIFTIVLYFFGNNLINYNFSLIYIILGNWVIPFAYSTIREIRDVADRFSGYEKYFKIMIYIFLVLYVVTIFIQFFISPIVSPFGSESFGAHNFVPYMSTGQYLEDTINSGAPLTPILYFLLELACLGLPAGFLIAYSWRRNPLVARIIAYIALPVALELIQYAYGVGYGSIDDVCTFLAGEIVGVIVYHILDAMYVYNHKRHFMEPKDMIKSYFK